MTFDFYGILKAYSIKNKVEALVIGAMDGISHDVIKNYVHTPSWKVAFIEPVREYMEELICNFGTNDRFWFINKGIAEVDGMKEFIMFDPEKVKKGEVNRGFGGVTTLYPPKNVMRSVIQSNNEVELGLVRRVQFECITVNTLLDMIPFSKINYVQIDTEGYDWMILSQFNTTDIDFIKIEHYSLSTEDKNALRHMLNSNGYAYFVGGEDTYAIKEKVLEEYGTSK